MPTAARTLSRRVRLDGGGADPDRAVERRVQLRPRAARSGDLLGDRAFVVEADRLAVLDVADLLGLLRQPQQKGAAVDRGVRGGVDGRAGEQRGGRDAVAEGAGDGDGRPELYGGVRGHVAGHRAPAEAAGGHGRAGGARRGGGAVGVDQVLAVEPLPRGRLRSLDPVCRCFLSVPHFQPASPPTGIARHSSAWPWAQARADDSLSASSPWPQPAQRDSCRLVTVTTAPPAVR